MSAGLDNAGAACGSNINLKENTMNRDDLKGVNCCLGSKAKSFLSATFAVALLLTGCVEPPKPFRVTLWKLAEVAPAAGQPLARVPRESQLGALVFDVDGSRLTGMVGCQALVAGYRREGDALRIENIELTGSRCHNPRSDAIADHFIDALKATNAMRLDEKGGRLELLAGHRLLAVMKYYKREKYEWKLPERDEPAAP